MRALSSSLYKDNTFSAEMQIDLTFRNNLRNVKRRVLHTRAAAMYYITREYFCGRKNEQGLSFFDEKGQIPSEK